jgi:hypothetical protein
MVSEAKGVPAINKTSEINDYVVAFVLKPAFFLCLL